MKILFIIPCLILLFTSCGCSNREVTVTNPLPVSLGDPFLLRTSSGKFYMYGTSEKSAGFKTYSSDDLITWKDEGVVYRGATPESWTVDCFWAPEVYERAGKYYMFFSANWKENPTHELENFRIGAAVSDHPGGPFKELLFKNFTRPF